MNRISTNMTNDDMQFALRRRQVEMNELQNKMAKQNRIGNLRDDPEAAAHSSRYQSYLTRLNRYRENAETLQSNYRIAEGHIRSTEDLMLRIRDLAIQGAQSTTSTEEKRYMAQEIDQYLNQLVEIANARGPDGTTVFAGDRSMTLPFRVLEGRVEGSTERVITGVQYVGNMGKNKAEISEGSYMTTNFPGNEIFWAEQQQIFAAQDATGYQVPENSSIFVDGQEIRLSEGDSVGAVIAKINESGAAVKAELDPVRNALVLSSTTPHQLWIEDGEGGTVLRDLGILQGGRSVPPDNTAEDAWVSGGSLFDMVMRVRDKLFAGDGYDVGGAGLKGIDLAHENLRSMWAELGAKDQRLESIQDHIAYEIPEVQQKEQNQTGLDLAEAITNLKMLENSHKTALQTAARIIQPTLLDFLR